MKTLLVLNPIGCGAADTKKFGIYPVLEDKLVSIDKEENETIVPYDQENLLSYPDAYRWVKIQDESGEDFFEVYEENNYCVVCENDYELAVALLQHISGLASAIVSVYATMYSGLS
jgi:hypothetical protein